MSRIEVELIHPDHYVGESSFSAYGNKFGRHIEHDSRSLHYRVPAVAEATWEDVRYDGIAPILDQGNLGSCTGNAAAALISYIDPSHPDLPRNEAGWESLAVEIYKAATKLDAIPGTYPPDDTGSTGLAAAKAVQKVFQMASGYRHVTNAEELSSALQTGPVMVGTFWFTSMFYPDTSGLVQIEPSSGVAGGHEYVLDEIAGGYFGFRNSWGTSFGVGGRFYIDQDDFLWLLEQQGDATQLIPVHHPAPTPTPPAPGPAVNENVLDAYKALKKWAEVNGVA